MFHRKFRLFVSLATCVLISCNLPVQSTGTFSRVGNEREVNEKPECFMSVQQQIGCFFSPVYPYPYPQYSSCAYEVKRFSSDVCEVKLTFNTFSVSQSPGCIEDYLEIQNKYSAYKLCGVLPSGSEKVVTFPLDSDVIRLKFRGGYHRAEGFSISVKQLRYSCPDTTTSVPNITTSMPVTLCDQDVTSRYGRITSPNFPKRYLTGQTCAYTIHRSESRACRVELDFRRFDVEYTSGCQKDFLLLSDGSRLCGTTSAMKRSLMFPTNAEHITFMFTSGSGGIGGNGFDIQVTQLPGPCSQEKDATAQIHQCDQVITTTEGTFTSPGYPNSFGPNYECRYTVRRPDSSVCELELDFVTFDVGRHNPATCSPGAYFELPGRIRICQPYRGRKVLRVPEFQEPVIFWFVSDNHSSGRGFKIDVTQIPNTCKGYEKRQGIPGAVQKCHQEVQTEMGYFSSPKYETCEYVVRRANSDVCGVQLQISLRGNVFFPCATNYVALPDGQKLCIEVSTLTKIPFPKNTDLLVLVYHGHDAPEFNLLVTQLLDSCPHPSIAEYLKNLQDGKWTWKFPFI